MLDKALVDTLEAKQSVPHFSHDVPVAYFLIRVRHRNIVRFGAVAYKLHYVLVPQPNHIGNFFLELIVFQVHVEKLLHSNDLVLQDALFRLFVRMAISSTKVQTFYEERDPIRN